MLFLRVLPRQILSGGFMSDEKDNRDENGKANGLTAANTLALRQEVARRAKQLGSAALELEQLSLLDEPEFEDALLLPNDEIKKRYTGEQSKQILWRRDTAAYMLGIGVPKEHIAKLLRMNPRLVTALAMAMTKGTTRLVNEYADALLQMSAEAFAAARLKIEDANYLGLMTGGAILVDKHVALKSMGLLPATEADAIEVETSDPRRAAFVERVKQLTPAAPANGEKK